MMMRSGIGRFELPSSFEEVTEPGVDIFGAAILGAPPDLGQIIIVKIMSFILHGATPGSFRRKRYLRHPPTASDIPTVVQLYVLPHFGQKPLGNPVPAPFLGYLDGRIGKNQCDDDVPHAQSLVG
jgi:hypothetical protein